MRRGGGGEEEEVLSIGGVFFILGRARTLAAGEKDALSSLRYFWFFPGRTINRVMCK